ncbi:MAG: hypothetical protein RL266_302 [Bacteroidota bacterium]
MPWYRHLLWPIALIYSAVVGLRNVLFNTGILHSKQFQVPVICVGNLEMGGTGKSRVVMYIVKLLLEKDRNVAVISRGYGRSTKGFRTVELSASSVEVGDEPLQLKRRCPKATVVVCEDRSKGIERLLKQDQTLDYVVMDDGFQHRWVNPSLSILVTNADFPFEKNWPFPVGTLRESKRASVRADLRLFTDVSNPADTSKLLPNAFYTSTLISKSVCFHGTNGDLNDDDSVISFCGIANPQRFETAARGKLNVIDHINFADHHNYTRTDVRRLREKMDSFGAVVKGFVTTEKDAARLIGSPLLDEFGNVPIYYLPVEIEFLFGGAGDFEKLILEHGKHA